MKGNICHYLVFVMGQEEPIYLNYARGMELCASLVSGNPPKFVYIDGNVVSVSSIREVRKKENMVMSEDFKFQVQEQRELTEPEEIAKKKLDMVTSQRKQLTN
jgi:hypothetical protein